MQQAPQLPRRARRGAGVPRRAGATPASRRACSRSSCSSIPDSVSARLSSTICTLLRGLAELARADVPLLVGLSRKSLLGKLTGRAAHERLDGSVALAVIAALQRGAHHPRTRRGRDRRCTEGGRGAGLREGRGLAASILWHRWRARTRGRAPHDGGLRAAAGERRGARAGARGRHGAHRQGHAPLGLHVRVGARGGLRRRRRQRDADRPAADARHRLHDAPLQLRFRGRHQRLAQPLRRQRHQVLRRLRRQAVR